MKRIYVDITAIEALLNRKHKHHNHARSFLETSVVRGFSLVSSRQMLFSLADGMRTGNLQSESASVISALIQTELIIFEPMSQEDERESWRIFKAMTDQWWTFSHCAAMALINRLEINTVFGFDPEFTHFGLKLLPEDHDS